VIGWSAAGPVEVDLPAPPRRAVERGGDPAPAIPAGRATLTGSVRYFRS